MRPQQKSNIDEAAIIQRAKHNDRMAQAQLYERYVDAVYRYMIYRTGDHALAEDLTAEVFASVLFSLPRYEDKGLPFGAWLFRIAKARLVDYWRVSKRRDRHVVTLSDDIEALLASDDDSLANIQAYQDLLTALDYLTKSEREIVLLRFAAGLDNKDIALAVRSNPNAVKSMMHRALRKLRKIMARQEEFYNSDAKERS